MDILLVGAGLANCLIAARLFERRREVRFLLLEAGESIGGGHLWSFHEADLSADQRAFLLPFITYAWAGGTEFRFPGRARILPGGYASVTPDRLAAVLSERFVTRIRTRAPVAELGADHVVLASGERIAAKAVVDGRGLVPAAHLDLGYRTFLSQEIALTRPHGLTRPLLMDAAVAQEEGLRFVRVLPLDPFTVLVEDTSHAEAPDVPVAPIRRRTAAYVAAQRWPVSHVVREERGALPLALGGDPAAVFDAGPAPQIARTGLAAGLFHPATGYALPDAVRLADLVSTLPDLSGPALAAAVRRHGIATWKRRGFYRFFNRVLFRAAAPEERFRMLARLYGLPGPLVARFHADRLTFADKARILARHPTVPPTRVLRCLAETRPALP